MEPSQQQIAEKLFDYLFLGLGFFFVLSLIIPWPLLFIANFIDFAAVVIGIAEATLWTVPIVFILMSIVAIANLLWARHVVHNLMDNFMLFIISFFACIPLLIFTTPIAQFFTTKERGVLMISGWLGTYLLITTAFKLWVLPGFNRYTEKMYEEGVPRARTKEFAALEVMAYVIKNLGKKSSESEFQETAKGSKVKLSDYVPDVKEINISYEEKDKKKIIYKNTK